MERERQVLKLHYVVIVPDPIMTHDRPTCYQWLPESCKNYIEGIQILP